MPSLVRMRRSGRVRRVAAPLLLALLTSAAVASTAAAAAMTSSDRRAASVARRGLKAPKKRKKSKKDDTPAPTPNPTLEPTIEPTRSPTESPIPDPTAEPTNSPIESPTDMPTGWPTNSPTNISTLAPTEVPTSVPSIENNSAGPTHSPWLSASPTTEPTNSEDSEDNRVDDEIATIAPTNAPVGTPSESPSMSPVISTPPPSSKDRSSASELPLPLPLMSLTLTLPSLPAAEVSSESGIDMLVNHMEQFFTGMFDSEFLDHDDFQFLRAEMASRGWVGWPVPKPTARVGGGRRVRAATMLVGATADQINGGRRHRLDGDVSSEEGQGLSAVSATLSGDIYFDGQPLPSDEAVRYFLLKWFNAPAEENGTNARGETVTQEEEGTDFAHFLSTLDASNPLSEVVSYEFSLYPVDSASVAAAEDAPQQASDRQAPNALAAALGVFVPIIVLIILFIVLLIRRRRQSAAMVAKGFGRGAVGQSVRSRLRGGDVPIHIVADHGPPEHDDRGSNSFAGLSIEESMPQSSSLMLESVCVESECAASDDAPSTEITASPGGSPGSSPPVSPQLLGALPMEGAVEAGGYGREPSLSQWVAGHPVPPTSAPSRGQLIPVPAPLLPPMPADSPDPREEALSFPPYDPRRLEAIIGMSKNVVSEYEGKQKKRRAGGGR